MKVFIRNTITVGIGNIISYLKAFLLFVIITKMLGAVDFGIWSQLLVTLKLATPFAFLGLISALIRFLPGEKNKDTAQEIFYSIAVSILALSLLVAFILFVFSNFIAISFAKDIKAAYLIRIIAFFFPIYVLWDLFFTYFLAVLKIKKYTFILIMTSIVEMLFVILAIYSGWKLLGLVLAMMCSRLVTLFFMLPPVIKDIGFKRPNFTMLASLLSFGLPLLPVSFSSWIMDSSDRYLIGFFLGPKDVGVYSASYTLSSLVLLFVIPLSTVFYPTISQLWNNGKRDEFREYLSYSIKYLLICIIPFGVLLILLGKPLLRIFSTKEFFSGNLIILIITLGLTIYSIALMIEKILAIFKKTKFILLSYFLAAMTNFITNLILIPKVGILGAAIAMTIGFFVLLFLILSKTLKHISLGLDIVAVLKSILASIVVGILLFLLNPTNLISILIAIFLSLACYLILMILMKAVYRNELLFFKHLLGSEKLAK